jgi:hypothetical protein
MGPSRPSYFFPGQRWVFVCLTSCLTSHLNDYYILCYDALSANIHSEIKHGHQCLEITCGSAMAVVNVRLAPNRCATLSAPPGSCRRFRVSFDAPVFRTEPWNGLLLKFSCPRKAHENNRLGLSITLCHCFRKADAVFNRVATSVS